MAENSIPCLYVPISWKPVLVKGHAVDWHRRKPANVSERDHLFCPKVYRWIFLSAGGEIEFVYIGQSENFQTRISKYRLGNQPSAMRRIFSAHEDRGGTVRLEFLDLSGQAFRINGKLITERSLLNHGVRLMLEGIAVVAASASGLRVLNRIRPNAGVSLLKRSVTKKGVDWAQVEAIFEKDE